MISLYMNINFDIMLSIIKLAYQYGMWSCVL